MSFTPIVVTGTYTNADGSVAAGTITFTLNGVMEQPGKIVAPSPISVNLVAGAFSTTLLANNDSTTTPAGLGYSITEDLGGVPRTYTVVIPHTASSGTIDLSVLSP